MVVVVIVGLLAVLSIPAFDKARTNAYASRIANNFRVFSGAFETHVLETGTWAPDGNNNNLPATVQPYLENTAWYAEPLPGANWDWEQDRLGYTAAVALVFETDIPEVFRMVDAKLDDGDLSTGFFVKAGDRYLYILEE